jgi:2-polyprenyl-3-methyl-5-hydroxy-6-metoxy-1,4-benzoquinol methylase
MTSRIDSDSQRVADHWSQEGSWQSGRGLYWLELPSVQHRLNQKVSGQPDLDWLEYTLQNRLAGRLPLNRCLSLGCGEGGLERRLASLGAFRACDAVDVAEGSISRARTCAAQHGYDAISYSVNDANTMSLPRASYDVVWASGAVHHFAQLEHVFEQVAASLTPCGLFVLNEYVGPSRFQFALRQRQVIQACFDLLPKELRRLSPAALQRHAECPAQEGWRWLARRAVDKLSDGDLLPAVGRRLRSRWSAHSGATAIKVGPNLPTARSVEAVDPSEAVRSAEMLPLLRRYFQVAELRPLGGTILQFLLADISGNFQDANGEPWLQVLFAIEDALIECGDLQSDFAYVVATPLANGQVKNDARA